ncbi:aminoglycoside phosphotransferase family protein [Kineococcus endophyticus]|uniref:Aminoglycoside phosphotransferase family protein n=1 Tax=Kineococcus endophyticus TaxID=1181883 RepID=A0ABV3P595_9ACTN
MDPDLHPDDEVALTGGGRTAVTRRGDVVLRPATPWSQAVIALLHHLAERGFAGAPRPVGTGFAADGREAVEFVPGEVLAPAPWADEAVGGVGVALRGLHRAVADFEPPAGARWQPWFVRELGRGPRVVGHGDTGPWNWVSRAGFPVALVDWEAAGPVDPLVELAQAGWLNCQLVGDVVAERQGLGSPLQRARQLRQLLDGYGLPLARREELVELLVEVAVADAAAQADEAHVRPESTDPEPLWALAWRTDSARWILRHRALLLREVLRPW